MKLLISMILICGFGCSVGYSFSKKPPSIEIEKPEVPSKPPIDAPILDEQSLKDKVTSIALNDQCSKVRHDNQGTPPKGYLKGIALSYARAVCNPNSGEVLVASQPIGPASKDALAHYGLNPKDSTARLQTVYALMIGSAARESSWRWCVGKDPGASNTSSETCEAGLYQTSYNSRSADPVLPLLFEQFKKSSKGCFTVEYKGATTCSEANMKNWGGGEGVTFQKLSKDCPGFATEYHAAMVRVRRTHYGPINLKKSLIVPACVTMFEKVRQAVVADPSICSVL